MRALYRVNFSACFLDSGTIYSFTFVRLIIKLHDENEEKENSVSRVKSCLEI